VHILRVKVCNNSSHATKDDFEDKDYDDLDENFCPPPSEGVGDSDEDVMAPAFSK
jgi:hypothetical protein